MKKLPLYAMTFAFAASLGHTAMADEMGEPSIEDIYQFVNKCHVMVNGVEYRVVLRDITLDGKIAGHEIRIDAVDMDQEFEATKLFDNVDEADDMFAIFCDSDYRMPPQGILASFGKDMHVKAVGLSL